MKPTYFEKGASECVEHYSWDAQREQVTINYSYRSRGVDKRLPQRKAIIFNKVWRSKRLLFPRFDSQTGH